jgi:proteasome accessory factor A
MIEDRWLSGNGIDLASTDRCRRCGGVARPEPAHQVTLRDGRRMTACSCRWSTSSRPASTSRTGSGPTPTTQTRDVLARWESTLDRLAADPMSLSGELDWVAKLAILEGYREREGLGWDAPKLHLVDLQYADVRPDKGLYNRLVERGRMQRLLSEDEVERAVAEPPADTRAYFRGTCIARYPSEVAAASWDSVIFDVGRETLQRVPTLEPLRGTKAHVGALLDSSASAVELVEKLTARR